MIDTPATERSSPTSRTVVRLAVRLAILIVGLVALALLARQAGDYIPRFEGWVDGLGFWGPVAFIVGYMLATVAFVPGLLLTLAGGAVFGLTAGTLYVFTGATLGATAAFLIARYFARDAIEAKLADNQRFAAIDRAIGREGRKIVFLLRLCPFIPFILLNYALGLTKVRLVDYLLACLGMLPATVLYTYYGKVGRDVATLTAGVAPERNTADWVVQGVGLLAAIVVTGFVTRLASRALKGATDD